MAKRFQGVINEDIRDSVPDWAPYEQPKPPQGAPNVLYIVWDDVGFSAFEPFGGPIETPTMNRIAEKGLRYTQFHTTALCSPTRAAMLTGRNHTTVGMACIGEATTGFPNSNGHIPFETATLAEVLVEQGYNTYMLGKWHLCPEDEMNLASTKRNWPLGRGFERYYGFLGGETSQWHPDLVYDNHPVGQPYSPEEGYHFSTDIADKAIEFIADAKQIAPDKPFFMYFCPGVAHAPHHVAREWADRYKGRFDQGYEKVREETLARQKEMGIVPADTEMSPMNPMIDATSADGTPWAQLDVVRPWDSLDDDEKRLFARMGEVYAGMVSHTDYEIGRLIDSIEQIGELDNTIIVVISDNGASGEGGPNGSVNEAKFFNNIPDSMEENLKYLDVLGGPETYNHYSTGWAMAFNTPFKMWKRYAWNGGICDPLIVSWPKGIKAQGEVRDQYCHATDVTPTIYDMLGITLPDEVKGYTQLPLEGTSLAYSFEAAAAPSEKETQYYTMLGSRGIWHKGWKANTVHPTIANWGNFNEDQWVLYHVDEDRSEVHDLSAQHPEKLEQLKTLWYHEAGKYQAFPLEDRSAVEVLTTPRPQLSPPRDRYVYRPGTSEVPESAAVNVRNRSFKIAAEVNVSAGAQGVLFSHGSSFGGHSLYIKDSKLHYVYNWLGEIEQEVVSDIDIPTGQCVLGVSFDKEGNDHQHSALGRVSLYISDRKVGEGSMKTQPGKFSLGGEGLNVGRDPGSPVSSSAYMAPFAFTGGTIREVIIDVSGEPYVDLEMEALGMMKRD
ncbi:MAG: arylsulfatase [Actinomycetota bacterium]|nr:arylsulfatase [Actinomycetota bacterium]